MAGKSFFIDTTLCTACRGCQVACKNWNRNGTVPTRNTGSHQNPPDLDGTTFKLVRFSEVETDGRLAWYFFRGSVPPLPDSPLQGRPGGTSARCGRAG
jgi:formate dehydrogenase iron-sulfur subunit